MKRAASSAPWAAPTEQVPMLMRPPSRPFMAILKPSPLVAQQVGSRHAHVLEHDGPVDWLFQPIFFLAAIADAGAVGGMAKALMPAAPSPPVRAITINRLASPPPEMKALAPLTM